MYLGASAARSFVVSGRSPIEEYLQRFRIELTGVWWWQQRGIMAEVRGHLEDVAAEERAGGCDELESERRAVARFGDPAQLAAGFRADQHGRWRVLAAVAVVAVIGATVAISRMTSGPPQGPRVVAVEIFSHPRARHWIISASRNPHQGQVAYSTIATLVPQKLPTAISERGGVVRFVLSDGRTIRYGPRGVPGSIRRIESVLENQYMEREQHQQEVALVDQVLHHRPVQPATAPPSIEGGTAEQRQVIAQLASQVPLPAATQIRLQRATPTTAFQELELIPPTGHGKRTDQTWTQIANEWAGNAILNGYNAIARQRHLPLVHGLAPAYQNGAPIELHQPANPSTIAQLRHTVYQQAQADHLTVVRIALINLGGSNAYVEVRTPTPKQVASLNLDIPNSITAPQFSSTLILIENPCGAPITVQANYVWQGNFSGDVWRDRAWYSPLEGPSGYATPPPAPGLIAGGTARNGLPTPRTPCF